MCGDKHDDHSLGALIDIVASEAEPLSTTMRRLTLSRLRELQRLHGMMRLITGRDDWQRLTVDECRRIRDASRGSVSATEPTK